MDTRKNHQNGNESRGKRVLPKFTLRLFVTGQTPRSVRSVKNLVNFCHAHLKDRFNLEIIDVYQQPALAIENQIVAAPTLVKTLPLPLRRLVGDFSDEKRVLKGLDLLPV